MTLKQYDEEILRRMYDAGIIAMDYRPTEIVRRKVNWIDLQQRHNIKKSFGSVMQRLENKEYVSSHGKSGSVYSLTQFGVLYVKGNK